MCELLDERPVAGNSKKYRIENWKRYFEFDRSGQRFIITKFYEEPLHKTDKRTNGNNSIYVKDIEKILIDYLVHQEGFTCSFTLRKYFLIFGMINDNYNDNDISKIEELKKENNGISDFQINNFKYRTYKKLKDILITAINNLQNRGLISCHEESMAVPVNNTYKAYLLTEDEMFDIDNLEQEVLKQMGFSNLNDVYIRFKEKEYYAKFNAQLVDCYSIKYIYKEYILSTDKTCMDIPIADIRSVKLDLNKKIVNAINKQAISLYSKQEFKINDVEPSCSSKIFRFPQCYIEMQKLLSKELLSIKRHDEE